MLTYSKRMGAEENRFKLRTRPNLYLSIRNLLLEEVYSDVEEESPKVRELAARLKHDLTLQVMNKRDPFKEVAGADAGSQILPLASKQYAVISALVYCLPSGSRFFQRPESFSHPYTVARERFRGIVDIRRETKLYETSCGFIERGLGGGLLLIDGPLAFSNWWNMVGHRGDRQRLVEGINRLLDLCRDKGITVAGVVKRPSSRYIINAMELQGETELSDAFLLLHVLRSGERTDIFSPRFAFRRGTRSSTFLDSIGYSIYSFYGRFSRRWSIPPVRIDLPAFSLGRLHDVADYCYGSCFWGGIPFPIVRADEEVRISKRFIGEVYKDILSRVGCRLGEVSHLAPRWGEERWMVV